MGWMFRLLLKYGVIQRAKYKIERSIAALPVELNYLSEYGED